MRLMCVIKRRLNLDRRGRCVAIRPQAIRPTTAQQNDGRHPQRWRSRLVAVIRLSISALLSRLRAHVTASLPWKPPLYLCYK